MGFRVGIQCFESKDLAQDYVLSQLPPVLLPDGTLKQIEKVGKDWVYSGQIVDLSLPECSFFEQIQQGSLIGFSVVSLFALMYGFKVIHRLIHDFGASNDS